MKSQALEAKMYLEKLSMTDRVAVVTGAGAGIGRACAEALAEAGAIVVVADIDEAAGRKAASELLEAGHRADAEQLDVSKSAAVDAALANILARHARVDVLVNNAGIGKSFEPAENMTDEVWRATLDVNLDGLFWCCRAFGKHMLEAGGGVIVNVGSMSGEIVNRPQEQAQYNASKAAVHHLTRSLAAEWGGRGVRVNAVAPTYIETALTAYVHEDPDLSKFWVGGTPLNRMGRVDEVASVVHFLTSEASSLMTGSVVMVDGGYSCW
jgi:NAD(P)-dependent dehydrogenase (short-subunit alcohol dehydrogenase family)